MKVTYDIKLNKNKLTIDFFIKNKKSNNLIIQLPLEYGHAKKLFENIKILESNVKFINNKCKTSKIDIHVKYTFENLSENDYHKVVIKTDYAFFNGQNGLIMVTNKKNFKVTFNINQNLFISGIGQITSTNTYNETFVSLLRKFFVLSTNFVQHKNIIFTYYDEIHFFKPDVLSKYINETYQKYLKFFDIKDKTIFLVNYIDSKIRSGLNYGGDGLNYGVNFIVSADKLNEDDKKNLLIYISHEVYHHFNASSKGKTKWFNEGFTEFFCRFLILTKPLFIKEINKFVSKYYLNINKNMKLDDFNNTIYRKNPLVKSLPYTKGFMYCLYLYQRYGDKFLEKYKKLCIKDYYKKDFTLTNDILKSTFDDDNFNKYIINGNTIELKHSKTRNIYEPYFDFDFNEASDKLKINKSTGKIKSGKIESINCYIEHDKVICVIKQNGKTIEFIAQNNNKITIPWFKN